MLADPPTGIVGWLIVDDHGRHALRLDAAGAMQYAADHHGIAWALVVAPSPCRPGLIEANGEHSPEAAE